MTDLDAQKEQAIRLMAANPHLAHDVLFEAKHKYADPEFHGDIIGAWHDYAHQHVITEGFRGSAKSTRGEEAMVIDACFRRFKNGLVVGLSEPLALERLDTIKNEFMTNEAILEFFGDLRGEPWTEHKAALKNGTILQARGKNQKMRGIKWRNWRPDYVYVDDFEDEESTRDDKTIEEGVDWILGTLLPAVEPTALFRMSGNRLADRAVIVQLAEQPGWFHQSFPIMYQDAAGEADTRLPPGLWKASWPDKFPLAWIAQARAAYEAKHRLHIFNREYMCVANEEKEKTFQRDMIVVSPRVRTWEPTYAMFDPARTTGSASAETGYACWSYRDPKIIVWDAWGKLLPPSSIIKAMFDCDEEFQPVVIGVERDGLEQWLLEPLRTEQTKRARILPVRAELAPRDKSKSDFIKSIQPYFNAREVEFAKPLPDLESQLLNFPSGLRDIVNALAFFTRLRNGLPIFDDFSQEHVAEDIRLDHGRKPWLALNVGAGVVTGVLVQSDKSIRVVADWIEEGEPADAVRILIEQAALECGANKPRLVAGPRHWERYNNVGLAQAVARIPAELEPGTAPELGRDLIRERLKMQSRGLPAIQVSRRARWTLNAFAGGYAREFGKNGVVHEHAKEGVYRVLMEGLESFVGMLRIGVAEGDRQDVTYAHTADGRKFISARAS